MRSSLHCEYLLEKFWIFFENPNQKKKKKIGMVDHSCDLVVQAFHMRVDLVAAAEA